MVRKPELLKSSQFALLLLLRFLKYLGWSAEIFCWIHIQTMVHQLMTPGLGTM